MPVDKVIPSRRAFLRGRFGDPREPLRPPWAREKRLYRDCTACGDCIAACPEKILLAGDGGLPEINFTLGACTFCASCSKACSEGIFDPAALRPWSYKAKIADHCLAYRKVMCRSCGDYCDRRAIRFKLAVGGFAKPEISLTECNGCGACVATCPTQALEVKTEIEQRTAA